MILLRLIDIAGNAIVLISASLDFGSIQAGAYILCQLVDMQDMRNCYDSLLFAAAAMANSAYGGRELSKTTGNVGRRIAYGPGCSSIGGGAFTELGPFYPKGDGRGLKRNSMSWNRASNLFFFKSSAGVGWSYSNTTSDYDCGDDSTARDMLTFMLKWYEKFPKSKFRDLFLTGESYAGHYIRQLAVVLLDHNAHYTGFKFNIKGVASHGMISAEIGLAIMNDSDFEDYTYASPHNATDSCNNAIEEANSIVGDYINNYDVILDVCYPSLVQQELRLRKLATKISVGVDVCISYERRFYFNLPEVQKTLHANRTKQPYSWSMCTNVLNYSNDDGNINMLPLLKRIIQNHIPVWIFSGDQDSVVQLLGSRTLVRELAHDLHFKVIVSYGALFHKQQVDWLKEKDRYFVTF
ncbi:hypothetical protein RHMOL_Rhmol05G0053600 [Rhododendron molle]|uniref:Uncharacterized protein n=1 Tax=Rhododendron molle TaxID=49168 RepID=A0ACC0NL37_RHOML|nr:hypothetical protein RHMOL_Rhmol05G0053600 [Rhododendron molle]